MHYQHNNLLDVSAFEMPIKSIKDPVLLLKDINGIEKPTKMNNQVVVYRPDTMEILGRSRSNQYKIVNPVELFSNHAKKLVMKAGENKKELLLFMIYLRIWAMALLLI